MLLKDKNVIITGTARGMGAAMVEEFAKNGANIWACARKQTPEIEKRNKEVSEKYGINITPLYFDMTDYEAMKEAVKKIRSEKRFVDGLVNNAGITHNALFVMSDNSSLRQVFEVNFFAIFLFTQYIVKLMLKQNSGSIVNIASTAALDGNPGKSIYGASKSALIAMTKTIASEFGENGIRANCIAPGMTETEMILNAHDYVKEDIQKHADLRRLGQPSEIANTAMFLISDKSSYLTGQTIRVDGGMK